MQTKPIHSDLEVVKNEYSDRDYDINISPNTVKSMSPRAFSKVKSGKLIKLTVTGDKDVIIVDDFYNVSFTNAKLIINRQGLLLDTVIYEYNKDVKKNHITSQFPKSGKTIQTNDKISFVISKGNPPNYYIVPNLINMLRSSYVYNSIIPGYQVSLSLRTIVNLPISSISNSVWQIKILCSD